MPSPKANFFWICGTVVLCSLIAGCSSPPPRPPPVLPGGSFAATDTDFTGSWEMDYARSDEVIRTLRSKLRQMRGIGAGGGVKDTYSPAVRYDPSPQAAEALIALAQFTDEITRSEVLQIDQTKTWIEVERGDGEFRLTCDIDDPDPDVVQTPFGEELCGWDGRRMVFHVSLPDGLTISHRMTLAPDGQKLHIATTVVSSAAPAPFTLSRFYDRFEPLPSDYECVDTLSKRRVCRPRRTSSL